MRQNECVSIVGLNGAGKTTLFNAISGLVPYRGAIRFAGRDLRGLSAAAIARAGVVHCPETRELFAHMSVRENLDLGGGHSAKPSASASSPGCSSSFLFSTSARGRRRARCRAANSRCWRRPRPDDAAEASDPRRADARPRPGDPGPTLEGDRAAATNRSLTLLLGEQNVTFALPHSDRVYMLDHGRIAWQGDPARFAAEMRTGDL